MGNRRRMSRHELPRAAPSTLAALTLASLLCAPAARAQPAPVDAPPAATGAPASAKPDGGAPDVESLVAAVRALQKQVDDMKTDQAVQQATTGAAASPVDTDTYQDRLKIYGFTDMGLEYMWYPASAGLQPIIESRATTFVLGDINLFVDARPVDRWRALTEVRLTNYPDGAYTVGAPGQPFTRTSTTIQDTNSASGGWSTVTYGSIVLERAHIDYTALGLKADRPDGVLV